MLGATVLAVTRAYATQTVRTRVGHFGTNAYERTREHIYRVRAPAAICTRRFFDSALERREDAKRGTRDDRATARRNALACTTMQLHEGIAFLPIEVVWRMRSGEMQRAR